MEIYHDHRLGGRIYQKASRPEQYTHAAPVIVVVAAAVATAAAAAVAAAAAADALAAASPLPLFQLRMADLMSCKTERKLENWMDE